MSQTFSFELGILGAGNMAEAITRGILGKGLMRPDQILAADVAPQRREFFDHELHIRAVADNNEVARQCSRLLLSVKPQQMQAALANVGTVLHPQTLVISIAAAVSTSYIEKSLGPRHPWHVVRAMPNTPMLVGEGTVAIAPGARATAADVTEARRIFESAAQVIELPENLIDAVTAMSGSGPAYFFYLVEQMIRAGVQLGLTEQQSRFLAVRTAQGAAKMLEKSSDSPAELRRKVTSPGGTTQAAIAYLEAHQTADAIVGAIVAAEKRGKELAL
jgi:pyrroline-5-carboxylate reductase